MNDDEAFVQAIAANPNDDTLRLVYADWLEERADVRGAYLRLDCMLDASREQANELESRLAKMAAQLDKSWLLAMGRRIDIVMHSYQPDLRINLIKVIYEETEPRSLRRAADAVNDLECSAAVRVFQVGSKRRARRILERMRDTGAIVSAVPTVD